MLFRSSSELLACQVESVTPVCENAEQALESLLDFRTRLALAAGAAGLAVAATGAAPHIDAGPAQVSRAERYQQMGQLAGAITDDQYVNGTHVHVEVPTREDGVRVLNRLRPWLATVGAISANSPYWRGLDSRFASWRLIHYRRWSVQGFPPLFLDAADYDARLKRLTATDAVLDTGHVGWIARLSERYPTVEVRVADTQLEAREAVLLALIIRGLVSTVLAETGTAAGAESRTDPELLDAGLWQAARFGLGGRLLNHAPGTGDGDGGTGAGAQVDALLAYISPALEQSGDYAEVSSGLAHVLASGTGAQRQREAVRGGGFAALSRLFAQSLTAR